MIHGVENTIGASLTPKLCFLITVQIVRYLNHWTQMLLSRKNQSNKTLFEILWTIKVPKRCSRCKKLASVDIGRWKWNNFLCKTCLKKNYTDYLKSPHWKAIRQKALKRAGYKCQLCSETKNLQVHHNTYERLGCEYLTDLTVLCNKCHKHFHGR